MTFRAHIDTDGDGAKVVHGESNTVISVEGTDAITVGGRIAAMLTLHDAAKDYIEGRRGSLTSYSHNAAQQTGISHANYRAELEAAADRAEDAAAENELQANVLLGLMENPPPAPTLPVLNIEGRFSHGLSKRPVLTKPLGELEMAQLMEVATALLMNAEGYRRYVRTAREQIAQEWGYENEPASGPTTDDQDA